MSYDFEKTSVDLYRAVFVDNYAVDVSCYLQPDKDLANAADIAPILHPAFESAPSPELPRRPPDIVPNRKTGLYDPDSGGTSVFDRRGVLRSADWDFWIPGGTDVPPGLKVKNDGFSKRLKATHYTIMPAKPMQKICLMGQLDNFTRNAIRCQYEKARGL